MADAVVIGSGPNGLVAANLLADHGWDVVVLEAQPEPGGGARSFDPFGAGTVVDLCSAFYPLAAVSPAMRALDLPRYGLRWRHTENVLAHPLPDGRCAVLGRDPARTAESLDALTPGDGEAWSGLHALWQRIGPEIVSSLFTPFPPVRAGIRLAAALGVTGGVRLARHVLLPVRQYAEEQLSGPGTALLLAGSALHADLGPDAIGSLAYGWLLTMLGHEVGFPAAEGGAQRLTDALVRRLTSRGGEVVCDAEVTEVVVRHGRAVGVRVKRGDPVEARRAVLADVAAPHLYGRLLDGVALPGRLRDDMRRYPWGYAVAKVDWLLSGPVPWAAPAAATAGNVHLADSLDELTRYTADLTCGDVPGRPYLWLGQMTTADPPRAPAGRHLLWAYTHVPREVRGDAAGRITGAWDERDRNALADRLEERIERYAPGFRDLVADRHVQAPPQLEAHDANFVGGSINGGSMAPYHQLLLRPNPGLGRPETPVAGLYLASASAHPGGGVHGGCGANAARAALRAGAGLRRGVAPRLLAVAASRMSSAGRWP